jgi:hypothetical protein
MHMLLFEEDHHMQFEKKRLADAIGHMSNQMQ